VDLNTFQKIIEKTYYERDSRRGIEGTFMWFAEEVGELSRALRGGRREEMTEEFADVLAWLCTLASLKGVDMNEVVEKYASGCPACGSIPCGCP